MTRSAVKTVTDFVFQSDFQAPAPAHEDDINTVSVTARELAELLANARAEGMAAAHTRFENEHADRLNAASDALKTALTDLLALAEHLDQSPLSAGLQCQANQLIATACAHIVSGQRDLFADQ